ncbi:MAG: hypothetical protein LC795_12165 [Acidobacteria bacterium]|nr:hypothetical protein [Acidobacteriota bacterium]
MRRLTFFLTLAFVALLAANSANAQADPPPPPPPVPDYSPQRWKEYVYEQDNVRFRFPVEPKIKTTSTNESFGTVMSRSYRRESFLVLELTVNEYPADIDFEKAMPSKELLEKMRDAGLAEVKDVNPKVIRESDITVDGHAGKFLHVETSNGQSIRLKFFVVKNRMYFSYAEVRKGQKHGTNYENDFEQVAMGFLDSIRLVSAGK